MTASSTSGRRRGDRRESRPNPRHRRPDEHARLNASIEAARVGEADEGFGVVADEIETLAEEVQRHSTEIEETVDRISGDAAETFEDVEALGDVTDEVQGAMDETVEYLAATDESAWETSGAIDDLANATDDHADKLNDVASQLIDAMKCADGPAAAAADVADVVDDHREVIDGIEPDEG